MKLTLELNNGRKIVVENKNVNDTEYNLGTLSVEYLWEQLKAKIETENEFTSPQHSRLKALIQGLHNNG